MPGQVHQVVCQREGGHLTHIIDGNVVATYDDDRPMTGIGHETVGFYIFGTGKIDNLKVYTKGDDDADDAPKRFAASSTSAGGEREPGTITVDDPLFEELFGDKPGPTHFFSYGGKYDPAPKAPTAADDHRETAKRFGFRFVFDEQLDEAAKNNLIVYGRQSQPEYAARAIATESRWVEPGAGKSYFYVPEDPLPAVFGSEGWIMDPRYQQHLVREIERRAMEYDRWGVPMFDELWTHYVIKPPPRDKWYGGIEQIDREIREKYGYGKFGIPASHEGGSPFEHIAYRRWAGDQWTQTFAQAYKTAKATNPDMKVIGPTEGSNGSSADIEAWAPYFDIMGGQTAQGGTSAYFDSVRVGAITKSYADLTDGTPIWMMVHLCVRQAARRTPEDVREAYSQVFRNGGQGLWLMHSEFYEAELEDAMFAEPARWRAMLQLTETIRDMRLPKLPKADCAILWASDTMHTTMWGAFNGDNDRIISAYTVLGPLLRSWFHFVSDRQIDRDTRDLNDYKVLYVPFATYQRASVVDKIADYVDAGGTVVCTDTDAFTWNLDGEKHGQRWEKLSGVRKTDRRDELSTFTTSAANPLGLSSPITMTSISPGWNIEALSESVQVLAAYDDGSPAVTLHPYGKGKVIFFAADPLYATDFYRIEKPYFSLYHELDKDSLVTPDAPIVKFIEAVQKSAGAEMDRDIWRFKLPPFKHDPYQKETGLCLTNNYVFDVNAPQLLEPNNVDIGGTYTYSRAPTGIPDIGAVSAGEAIGLRDGKLTNRLAAYETRQRFGPRERNFEQITPQWIVGWTDAEPVLVTFDLKADRAMTKFRLFHSGTMPALTVSGSRDRQQWTKLAAVDEQSAGADVKDVAAAIEGEHRYIKLDFSSRQSGETFELCEIELWGPSAH